MSFELTAVFDDVRRAYVERGKYRYAIIKHNPDGRAENNQFNPDTIPMQGKPFGEGKGDQIHILSDAWHHIEAINAQVPKAYPYTREVGANWINLEYDVETPYSTARAERLLNAGNFIRIDAETYTHVHIVPAFDWKFDARRLLDPKESNWFRDSASYWKACAISKSGWVINVGNDLDVYFPIIAEGELWMNKKDVELLPIGPNYLFRGCNVYDGVQPLLTVVGRTRIFHTAWTIETFGVIPPD